MAGNRPVWAVLVDGPKVFLELVDQTLSGGPCGAAPHVSQTPPTEDVCQNNLRVSYSFRAQLHTCRTTCPLLVWRLSVFKPLRDSARGPVLPKNDLAN